MRFLLIAFLLGPAFTLAVQAQAPAGAAPATTPVSATSAASADEAAVRAVLRQYQRAVERLDTAGTHRLFGANAQVFESGGAEGTYRHYAAHHLAPELGEFSAFTFSDYTAAVEIDGPYAFTEEAYTYTINLKKGPKEAAKAPIVRAGVATSVLRKNAAGQWQIVRTHSSSRKPSAPHK